jgi:hypothetical protein
MKYAFLSLSTFLGVRVFDLIPIHNNVFVSFLSWLVPGLSL